MSDRPPASVLFVCTANECRSPFAAALARRRAAGLPVEIDSAGIEAWRRPVPDTGLRLARELGLDLDRHVSRAVHPDFLEDHDLVLGLSREHIRELAALEPGIGSRLFTVRGLARWAAEHPRPAGRSIRDWLASAGAVRDRLISADPDDDVADPLGRPLADWRAMVATLEPAIDAIVAAAYPDGAGARAAGPSSGPSGQ